MEPILPLVQANANANGNGPQESTWQGQASQLLIECPAI